MALYQGDQLFTVLVVLDKWTEISRSGGSVDVIYCDFMKAFDKVPHKR